MYLSEIKAHGFKSFANNTKIIFDQKITGIVGPNGSGKSNIVDAIKWVLGEQSVKSLRGGYTMTDVIFSGSKERPAANVASVSLVFNNEERLIPLDHNQVELKRKVYRDGENEYFINNTKCRLKDVTDLLLDSNLAKESFNIISQGKIDQIINSKPVDRKIVFEEAAGVLKYKKKKEEALRKLEKTNDNLNRIQDIMIEIEDRLKPLTKERAKALNYLKYKEELNVKEIALLAHDIDDINYRYQSVKENFRQLSEKQLMLDNQSLLLDETAKVQLEELNIDIVQSRKQLIEKIKISEQLNSKKQILIERKTYQTNAKELEIRVISLKEQLLENQNQIKLLEQEKSFNLVKEVNLNEEKTNQKEALEKIFNQRNQNQIKLVSLFREEQAIKQRIEAKQLSIEHNAFMPASVLKIINNQRLDGIIGALGSLFEVEEKYSKAITISLGNSINSIVVNDEVCAKMAINYLKENNLGRVTFLPQNIIKERTIDQETLELIKQASGFVDMANNLVKYNPKIKNIINYFFALVVVVDNIDNANLLAKKLQYRYRIVTLDGELLNVGGSITGGRNKMGNIITEKYELEKNIRELNELEKTIKTYEEMINQNDEDYQQLENKIKLINEKVVEISFSVKQTENEIMKLAIAKSQKEDEINSVKNIVDQTLDKAEKKLIEDYYNIVSEKEQLEQRIKSLEEQKTEISVKIEKEEADYRSKNKQLFEIVKKTNEVEVELNRLDVQLEHNLNYLSQTYNMTFEYAKNHYSLDDDEAKVRERVEFLKTKLEKIGFANLNAPAEFDQINERHQFLLKQKDDLKESASNLIKTIVELDKTMESEFTKIFKLVQTNFKKIFKDLFKGGEACIELTDPDNFLETGIEINAQPPGKKLAALSLLSGGEKALTAISLLFAILQTKPVSFCVFDEVEASLDEANVETFGNYIKTINDKTQFIIVTHKKKTMEYVDLLYGVTMQESGISRLVSVNLKDLN